MKTIRKVKIQDFKNLKSLFLRNAHKFMSKETWYNLWINPAIKMNKSSSLGWVYEINGKIIGHIGNYSTRYFVKKKKITCSVLHGWIVDKKYRAISINLLKKYLTQKNQDFFLGTTTNKKAGKIMKLFDFNQVPVTGLNYSSIIILNLKKFLEFFFYKKKFFLKKFILFILCKILSVLLIKNLNNWKKNTIPIHIKKIFKFDNTFNIFIKKYIKENKNLIELNRESKWNNWLMHKKITSKKIWVFKSVKNNKIIGYSACLIDRKDKFKYAQLLDVLVLKNNDQVYKDLMIANIKEAYKRNCEYFEYRNSSNAKQEILKFFSSIRIKLKHNTFYYKSNNDKIKNFLNNKNNWNPSSLDGDILTK
jgi:hypothetical protein